MKSLLILLISMSAMADEVLSNELQDARTAHVQTLQSRKDNKVFERDRAWDNIVSEIQTAIGEGRSETVVECDQNTYPMFVTKLKAKGYKIRNPISTTNHLIISW